jgi:copper resistance protein D
MTFVLALLVRWVTLGALAGLIGGLGLEVLVLPAGAAAGRLRSWRLVCAGALVLTAAAEILLRAGTMGGGGLVASVGVVPAVVERTHFGAVWVARVAALAALLVLGALRTARARLVGLGLASAVALSITLSGHAADGGDVTPSVLLDWVHVLAASLWIGGLVTLALVVFRADATARAELVMALGPRFSRLAGWCLAAVVATGVYNAWVQLPDVAALWDTPYGRLLFAKIGLVAALAALGCVNRYAMLPRLTRTRARGVLARGARRCRLAVFGPARARPSGLVRLVIAEAAVGVAVFGLTASLGESTPARHAGHVTRIADLDGAREPIRATMEAMHEAGGVPRGWAFRVPGGDAGRGQQVFSRLECFRCHRLRGEPYPSPSAAGPELTGIGGHHPASYIAESIVNPNAVIVRGPAYTGPDGLSTMPDYRDSLSVGELLDLVAYLETQVGVHRHRP